MVDILKELLLLIIAFCVGVFLLTYVINLPGLVTGKQKIVDEYYRKNFITNVPLDLFFILCYFLVAYLVMLLLKVKKNWAKLLTVAIVTALLTFFFCYHFTSKPVTKSFFSRWFNTVGYSSVIYDVILLVFIYGVYLYLKKYISKPV